MFCAEAEGKPFDSADLLGSSVEIRLLMSKGFGLTTLGLIISVVEVIMGGATASFCDLRSSGLAARPFPRPAFSSLTLLLKSTSLWW